MMDELRTAYLMYRIARLERLVDYLMKDKAGKGMVSKTPARLWCELADTTGEVERAHAEMVRLEQEAIS
jgi:hypothetical protein